MTKFIARSGIALMAFSLLAAVGCSPKVNRTVDVSQGDYYTAEEFKSLSKQQYDAYCAALDTELQGLNGSASTAQGEESGLRGQVTSIQNEVRQLQAAHDSDKAEVDAVQEEVDYFEGLPKVHVVSDGEFLQKISEYERIYADATKWMRIYRANKDQINDANLIYPGWELVIPRDWPSSWSVNQDEYLSRIASYWEVYGDGTAWPQIYEANRDQINDPDMIWPEWELAIPRN